LSSVARIRKRILLTAAAAAIASVVGCSRGPAPTEIVEPEPEATPSESPAEESRGPAENPAEGAPGAAPTAPATDPEPDPVAKASGGRVEESPEISVDLDEGKQATLAAAAERDLQEAVKVARAAQTRALSPEKLETLATVEGLVAAARDALTASDVQAAATLANKAKLLAAELAAN